MPLDGSFWSRERELLFRILFPILLDVVLKAGEDAMEELMLEAGIGVDWELVNQSALAWARQYTLSLSEALTETSQRFVHDAISGWIESGQPLDELIETLTPMFGEVRAELVATTEVTRAFAEGNLITWRESGLVEGKRWMTAVDELVCPICGGLDGQVVGLNGLFDGEYEGPPAHPRCRCWMTPVVEVK